MSIAVATDVHPSRLLGWALRASAAVHAGAAGALWTWPDAVHGASLLACVCALGAGWAFHCGGRRPTMRRLDISGLGELSLTVQHHMGPDAPRSVMRLLPGSTLWPGLLLLRLQADEGGALSELIVLPDSLPREQFRKLAVAITTIARRDSKCAESHKIH